MMKFSQKSPSSRYAEWLSAACAAMLLAACGGGDGAAPTAAPQSAASTEPVAAPLTSAPTTFQMDIAPLPAAVASVVLQPMFHVAPALLEAPDDADAISNDASARRAPRKFRMSPEFSHMSDRRLTVQDMQAARQHRSANLSPAAANEITLAPMATGAAATYSPAQIRAAYGLPALPVAGAALTAAQAAQLGAGQTIYIVDAMHDANAVAELAAFNAKFGLPTCTTKPIAVSATLPLAPASSTGCEFSVVYNTASAGMSATAPAVDSGWATEIALDVQWAHATAPLARIVLIEAASASLDNLLGGVKLANKMGPGVVSMSFGANEGSYTASVDAAFTAPNMTYLAATGDSGAAVSWPAVSPYVLAVGGTTLTYTGTGPRTEVGWSGTGGGTSAYTPTPSYQTNATPGLGNVAHRTVADVAFNADPASGQYVAVLAAGSSTVSWISAGGTSLSTPQWAGLIAVANALRAQNAKPVLGAAHAVLYGQISTVAGTYASTFADVTKGADGTCATCSAKIGYDQLTGLGTPNVSNLLSALAGSTVTTAPVVNSASISGKVGTALAFSVAGSAPNPVTYTLSGAPSGMTISGSAVSWATPVAGTYAVTAVAKDSKTGLTGQGVYTVVIAAAPAPVVTAASISGKVGTALSFKVAATSANPLTYSMTGAPSGMTISGETVSWTTPVAGTYSVTITAKDSKTGLSGQALFTIKIEAATAAPVVTAASISGKVGTALAFTVSASAPNPLTFSMSGAPVGMTISGAAVAWATPVAGTYKVTIVAKDSKTGLSGQAVYTVVIAAPSAPVVTATSISGKVGSALSFKVAATAANALTYSMTGAPSGMTLSGDTVSWATPVAGTYSVTIVAKDSKTGLSGQAVYTVKIEAATVGTGLVLTAPAMSGVAGKPLSGSIGISAPGASSISISISGAPMGMMFSPLLTSPGLSVNWASPVTGNYSLTVSATDNLGRSTKVVIPVTVSAR
jgi:subtilase family serine protease